MTRKIWNILLAQCIIGFLILSACKRAVLSVDTTPMPSLQADSTGEPKSTPAGQVAAVPESSPVGETLTQRSLTQAENGKTIQLPIGQRFALQLGDAARWEIAISDPNIVSRVTGSPAAQGVQGIYEAKSPGQATLTATSSQDVEGFRVTIEVPAGAPFSTTPDQEASEPLYLSAIRMITSLEGWALGASMAPTDNPNDGPQQQGIFRTANGGRSWLDVTPPSLIRAAPVHAYFATPQQAWLASAGKYEDGKPGSIVVYSTEDSGGTWQASPPIIPAAIENSSSDLSFNITFVDDQHGWLLTSSSADAGSESLNIFRTADGGQSWTPAAANGEISNSLPQGCAITGLTFRDSQTGWITGSCTWGRLFLYVTYDGGGTWAAENLLTPRSSPEDLFSQCQCSVLPPQFPEDQSGVLPISIAENDAASDFAAFLYLSQDGGQSWLPYILPVSKLNLPPVFADAQHGWVSDGKALYISRDGGHSWTWISKLPVGVVLGGLNFVTPQTGFMTDGLQLYATQDGGVTWTSWQPVVKGNG